VMQVGPLAQVLVAYAGGHGPTKKWAEHCLGLVSTIAKTKVGPDALHSTLGRHLARAIRCATICDTAGKHWEMLVGNIGSRYRFSYGVLGDNVNLGSRLEGLNKEYGTEILIGDSTAALVTDAFRLREVDRVRVVGKKKPVGVFELVAAIDAALPTSDLDALAEYALALEAYRSQRWSDSVRLFEGVISKRGGDGPSVTMLARCRAFMQGPPGEDWDGVYEATRK